MDICPVQEMSDRKQKQTKTTTLFTDSIEGGQLKQRSDAKD